LLEYKERNKHKTIKGYPGTTTFLDDTAIYKPVDFFIPAAL